MWNWLRQLFVGTATAAVRHPIRNGFLGAGALLAATATVGQFEGLRTKAYLDPVGIPTVCYGETKGVKLGDTYTKAECDEMFAWRLTEFAEGVQDKLEAKGIDVAWIPDTSRIAFVSLAYNIGLGAFGKSSVIKWLKAGDLDRACAAILPYVYAGGKKLPGLEKRRKMEYRLCMEKGWL